MQTIGSPINKMSQITVYVVLIFTGILNVLIIDFSYYMSNKLGEFSIIDLEMAGTLVNANAILAYWENLGVENWLYFHMGLDYLFIVCYTLFLFFACHASALYLRSFPFFVHLGLVIGWVQPIAGILDITENYALLHVLSGTSDEWWANLASWCAIPKFAIALSGMAYCVLTLTISTYSGVLSRVRHA